MKRLLLAATTVALLAIGGGKANAVTPTCTVNASTPTYTILGSDVVVSFTGSLSSCVKTNPTTSYTLTTNAFQDGVRVASGTVTKGCSIYYRPACGASLTLKVTIAGVCADSDSPWSATFTTEALGPQGKTSTASRTISCHEVGGGLL